MGMQVSKRRGGRVGRSQMSEINVTPFVDVMLVLLVIFMVTAPLLAVGVKVDLPETKAPPLATNEEPLTVTITADGSVFLQETPVTEDDLLPKMQALAKNGYDERIYIRADKLTQWNDVSKVMGSLNGAGYRRLALVNDAQKKSP